MCLLVESLKIKDNQLQHTVYHNNRMNRTREQLFGVTDFLDIGKFVQLPNNLDPAKTYKCRVLYAHDFVNFEIHEYHFHPLRRLKLVRCDDLDYHYKYADRSALDALKANHPEVDGVVIVQGDRITDCTYANMVFFDGQRWHTPEKTLLNGTKRQQYIDEGRILVTDILVSDIRDFTCARIINAMVDLDDSPDISIQNICW